MDISRKAALVIIDMQQGINHPKLGRRNNPGAEQQMLALLAAWRDTGRTVIHVRHFSRSPDSVFWPQQSGVEFQPEFLPWEGEGELHKQVPDAFCHSALEGWLRADGINQVVIVGVVTLRMRLTAPRLQGRTSAALNVSINVPQMLMLALGSALLGAIDYRWLIAATAIGVLGAALAVALGRRLDHVAIDTDA